MRSLILIEKFTTSPFRINFKTRLVLEFYFVCQSQLSLISLVDSMLCVRGGLLPFVINSVISRFLKCFNFHKLSRIFFFFFRVLCFHLQIDNLEKEKSQVQGESAGLNATLNETRQQLDQIKNQLKDTTDKSISAEQRASLLTSQMEDIKAKEMQVSLFGLLSFADHERSS